MYLNPMEVYGRAMEISHGREEMLHEASSVSNLLPLLLQHFSSSLKIAPEALTSHYSHIYRSDGGQNRGRIKKTLSNGVIRSLMSVGVQNLLFSNKDLFKWEFIRNCARKYSNDPFTSGRVEPIGVIAATLSEVSALAFANDLGIPKETARKELLEVFLLMGEGSEGGSEGGSRRKITELSYSCFVVFAVRIFVAGSGIERERIASKSLEKCVEECIRKMLHTFSERLTKLQQVLRLKVLAPLLSEDLATRKKALLVGGSIETVLTKCQSYYHQSIGMSGVGAVAGEAGVSMPPRPPTAYLDAPRAVASFVHNGLAERVGGLVMLWRAFPYSNHTGSLPVVLKLSEEALRVSPSPVPMSKREEKVLAGFMGALCAEVDEEAVETVLPLLVSYADYALDPSPGKRGSKSASSQLEDILRYGGARAVRSLAENRNWLLHIYHQLAAVGEYDEVLMNLACRLFACHGLLRMGAVALQAKDAIHSRRRSRILQTGVVSISFAEFEELFLRCAFSLWCEVGIGVPSVTPMQFPAFDEYPSDADLRGKGTVVSRYYQQQCAVAVSVRSSITAAATAWGTDFVWPFASTLLRCGVEKIQSGDTSDLCAFLGLEKVIVERLFEWKKEEEEEEVIKGNGGDVPSEITTQSDVESVPGLTSAASDGGEQDDTMGATDLLASEEVKSRSGALLEGILKSRTSAPLTPQKKEILRTILDGHEDATSALPLKRRTSVATTHESEGDGFSAGMPPAPHSPEPIRNVRQEMAFSPTRSLLDGTKEALWPVYGTYCSCGDSLDPGKLSGPNLFALLSKLGVLTDATVMSDIGILLHQISAHTHSSSVSIAATSSSEAFESPSLSFEEFLVFLCAFAQLRFDGEITAPILNSSVMSQELSSAGSQNTDIWLQNWKAFMGSSSAFRRLMEESVLPILRVHPLLAFPEDARHRDRYCAVFSLEVLLAVESSETLLREVYGNTDGSTTGVEVSTIMKALARVDLIPNVVSEDEVLQLIRDVIPEGQKQSRRTIQNMIFPQWEWVICVVAFQAVEKGRSKHENLPTDKNVPSQVADVISYIANSSASIPVK